MKFIKMFLAGLLAFVVGSFAVFFLWIILLVGIAGSMESTVVVPEKSILKIDLSEAIVDAPSSDPLGGLDPLTFQVTKELSMLDVLRAIDAAATDDRIQGIYLRLGPGSGGVGSAQLEEIRGAIDEFRASGKFVVAYGDTYSQGGYYLASVADAVYIQPEGGLDWSGFAFNLMFYKGLLDKLDLKVEVFRPTVCAYKSAVEPYILTKMSDANRRQMQELVDSMWETVSEAVCASRGIDAATMKRLTDDLEVSLPEEALEHGFVDGLVYEDQMEDVFDELGAERDDEDEFVFVTLGDYAAQVSDIRKFGADRVTVVYADGGIVDGAGSGKDVCGDTLAATLRDVRDDDRVKAVVLRVNSPGGSALASDVIWREIQLLKAEKPVIVSMGDYAASGGYYISCPADAIVADRMTLTGSIGVFGMYLYTPDALKNKLGITLDGVKSNKSAGMGSITPLTSAERAAIMRGVDKVYDTFTTYVAEGRNLSKERVLEIAGGRVWSGADALEIGLIDGYGGLKTAIAVAAEKAGLDDDFRVTEAVEPPTGFAAFLASLNMRIAAAFDRSELGAMMREYRQVQEALSQQGVVMYEPRRLLVE